MNKNVKLLCNGVDIPVDFSTFHNGERRISIVDRKSIITPDADYVVKLLASDSGSIIDCLLLVDALTNAILDTTIYVTLETSYIPYTIRSGEYKGRESLSVISILEMFYSRFNEIIAVDMCNFEELSPSLDYIPFKNNLPEYNTEYYILINPNHIEYIGGFHNVIDDYESSYIISPTKSAVNRATKAMNDLNAMGLIVFDRTYINGTAITKIVSEDTNKLVEATNLIVVDNNYEDRSALVSLAKLIKEYNKTARLTLVVTHVICSENISELIEYYTVVCVDNEYNRNILTDNMENENEK